MNGTWLARAIACAAIAFPTAAIAQLPCGARQTAEFGPPRGAPRDVFGLRVVLDGDTALVGAPGHDTEPGPIGGQGAAFVFTRAGGTWSRAATLTAGSPRPLDQLGVAVALDGDTAVVGAYRPGGSAPGAAFVFERTAAGWRETAELTASDGVPFDYFGVAVDVAGDTLLVGAARADVAGRIDAGAAYVFERRNGRWRQTGKLTSPAPEPEDRFGNAVQVTAETAVIGAYLENAPFQNTGAVYVFERSASGWSNAAALRPPAPGFRAQFGHALALSGATLVVGEPYLDTAAGNEIGAVHVFERQSGGWVRRATLGAGDAAPMDHFGFGVAIDGGTLLVGAPGHDPGAGDRSGAVHVFGSAGPTWLERGLLTAANGAPGDGFGVSVALAGGTALAGAVFDDTLAGVDAGAAFVFEMDCEAPRYVTFGRGCAGSSGTPALRAPNPPALGSTFEVEVTNLPSAGLSALALGFSDRTWNGLRLPLALQILGRPDCGLLVSLDFGEVLAVANGTATWSLAVPAEPALAGVLFYNQVLAFESGGLAAASAGARGVVH